MARTNPFARHLYLRIWLAVVGGVALLTMVIGWAWRIAQEQNAQNAQNAQSLPPSRELVLRDAQGRTLLEGMATRQPMPRAEGVEFRIETAQGETYLLQMAPRYERGGRDPHPGPAHHPMTFWARPPFGFLWLLAVVGLAVVVGVFPIIRRLTQRLQTLQRSVQRFGEGDLAVRVPEQGHDEVADLARQFNAAAERIERLVQSHKSLLANASHELRSPLARIRMGLELMNGGQASAALREEVQRSIAELDQLVEEILLASRLDVHEADMGASEPVDLVGLAAEECARTGAELEVHAEGLEVQAIARLLRRALRNLLENARRYSDGPVTMHLQRAGALAEVRVCDQGPGVPAELRERIFEPFYRLPGASERSGGVGLGLALVRSIAQRHQGTVLCEDNPQGRGACFVLRLPVVRLL